MTTEKGNALTAQRGQFDLDQANHRSESLLQVSHFMIKIDLIQADEDTSRGLLDQSLPV